jgi:DNA-binding transcriptional MocR family regulator
LGALQAFSGCEPRYDELRHEDGNRTPASYVDRSRPAGADKKLAYVVPSFADPTGETLSLAARERLLDLAAELDIPVIEDAAYAHVARRGRAAAADPGIGDCAARQHRARTSDLLRHLLQGARAGPWSGSWRPRRWSGAWC